MFKTGRKSRKKYRSERRLGSQTVQFESKTAAPSLKMASRHSLFQRHSGRLVGVLLLVLLSWVGYLVFTMDAFYVYAADIQGNQILSHEEIYQAAGVNNLSVFWVNTAAVQANLEQLPSIKAVDVALTLPANLSIVVEERRPVVVWQSGNQVWWVDADGHFLPPKADVELGENQILIIDNDARPVRDNDQVALDVIKGAQSIHQLKPDLGQLFYTRQQGLVFINREGTTVYVGKGDAIETKLIVAEATLQRLNELQIKAAYIDVRNPIRSIYRAVD